MNIFLESICVFMVILGAALGLIGITFAWVRFGIWLWDRGVPEPLAKGFSFALLVSTVISLAYGLLKVLGL